MLFLLVTAGVIVGGFTIVGLAVLLMESFEHEIDHAVPSVRRYGSR